MQDVFPIVVAGVIALIVGFILFYYRDYIPFLKRGPKKTEVDAEIERLLGNILRYKRTHEYNKAGLLVWQAFSVAASGLLGLERAPSQTARQFGLSMMQFEGVTQETVEPVYSLFEKARYGNEAVSIEEFNSGLTGLHRFLQIANTISEQMAGSKGSKTAEAEELDEEFDEEED